MVEWGTRAKQQNSQYSSAAVGARRFRAISAYGGRFIILVRAYKLMKALKGGGAKKMMRQMEQMKSQRGMKGF